MAQAIVDHQTAFLDKGPEFIAPLKMQQIADVVGVHVTTVSRAVDDKYVQTPRGIFPLKRFFGGGTTTAGGDEVAWDIIRIKLKEIVDKEDKNDPLSDDALVDELAKQGYKLARRTITKYRKALKIPSSRQRRRVLAIRGAGFPTCHSRWSSGFSLRSLAAAVRKPHSSATADPPRDKKRPNNADQALPD